MEETWRPVPDPDEHVDPGALTDYLCEVLAPAEVSVHEMAREVAAMASRGSQGMFGHPELDAAFDHFNATMAVRTAALGAELTRLNDAVRDKIVEHSDVAAGAAAELARAARRRGDGPDALGPGSRRDAAADPPAGPVGRRRGQDEDSDEKE